MAPEDRRSLLRAIPWPSVPTMALDAFAVTLGTWWLFSVGVVYTHHSFDTLSSLLPLAAIAAAALCVAWVRPEGRPQEVASPRSLPAPRRT